MGETIVTSEEFNKTNKQGIRSEWKIAYRLLCAGWEVQIDNIDGRQDIYARKNRKERIEIKNEDNYESSGNICIETFQGKTEKKYSGIMISESTCYIHTLGENCCVYRTQPMRLWLLHSEIAEKPFGAADNGNGGFILSWKSFLNFSWFQYLPINEIANSKIWNCNYAIKIFPVVISQEETEPLSQGDVERYFSAMKRGAHA